MKFSAALALMLFSRLTCLSPSRGGFVVWPLLWRSLLGHASGDRGLRVNVGSTTGSLQLLLDHQDAIAPEHNDPIHELLDDLGEVPTIESLIGNVLH